jgi:outer membrane immunogenic protein
MRLAIVLAAALGGFALPAVAADIPAPQPLPAPDISEAAPENNWSGFYLGALLGYSFGDADTDEAGSIDVNGIDGGVFAGANWQYNNLVLGIEGDVLGSALDGGEAGVSLDQRIEGSLRGRAGLALDRFLLYGTAGGAAADLKVSAGGDDDQKALLGWTAGAGVEAMLTGNLTARVEYRYTDYEDKTFTVDGADIDADLNTNSVRAGVAFKF